MKIIRWTLISAAAFFVSILLNAQNREEDKPLPTFSDVAYGPHERNVFDIWLTPSRFGDQTPLVIYIHGGGFRKGDKSSIKAQSLSQFQNAGLSVASIHYRFSDEGPYPIMMQDAARCLQFIRSRAEEWNIDTERIACYGGSAGAGITVWLALHDDLADPGSSDPVARQSTRIAAAGLINGQASYDIRTIRDWFGLPEMEQHAALYAFFGVKDDSEWESEIVIERMEDSAGLNHLTADDPPVYMRYGRGNVPVSMDTEQGVWVHHVRMGLPLQKAMEKMGLECVVNSPDHPEKKYGSLEAFLIEKLKAGG